MRINWAAEWPEINVKAINWDGMSNVDFMDNWRSMPAMARIGMSQEQIARNLKRYSSDAGMGGMSIQPEARHHRAVEYRPPEPPPLALEAIQLRDLPRGPAPTNYCGGWLREGSYTLLHSRAGVGKTAVVADLVLQLRTGGGEWFGQRTERMQHILWINGDMPDWQVHERLDFLDGKMEFVQARFVNLLDRQEEFRELCKGYQLVVIDNRSCLFQLDDANKAEAWVPLNNLLRGIADQGTAVLLMTHEGKSQEGGTSFGSSAQEWFVDTIIRLGKASFTQKSTEHDFFMDRCGAVPNKLIEFTKTRLCQEIGKSYFTLNEINPGQLGVEWRNWLYSDIELENFNPKKGQKP